MTLFLLPAGLPYLSILGMGMVLTGLLIFFVGAILSGILYCSYKVALADKVIAFGFIIFIVLFTFSIGLFLCDVVKTIYGMS